jgi:carbon-monoxide dehydrogenase large subunit
MFVIERLIDLAARRHGFDRVALRSRNLVSQFPYRNPAGLVYDSGDYAGAMRRVLELADWAGFESRRDEARARGRRRGIGLGHYIELNTGAPRERAEIRVLPEGRVEVVLGTLSAGQGHETSFAQLVAEWLSRRSRARDAPDGRHRTPRRSAAARIPGRSMRMGAVVMAHACDRIVEQGRQRASDRLEVSPRDLEFDRGRFRVKGTDRSSACSIWARSSRITTRPRRSRPIRSAARCARSKSIRRPAWSRSCATPRWTIAGGR